MTITGLLVFAAAYALAVASPGPGIASVVGQVLGKGLRAGMAQIGGILVGDLIWFTLAATGLAALAHAYAGLFTAIKWLGVAYLLWLAWKFWSMPTAGIDTSTVPPNTRNRQQFTAGLTLTLGNPKAMAFYLALLPAIVQLEHLSLAGFAEVALLIMIILPSVLMVYAFFAYAARGIFRSPRAARRLNRLSGTAMAGAALAIAARN